MKIKIGTLLDWTREEDDSPFYGVVLHDDDLKDIVVHRTNGGFIELDDPDVNDVQRTIEKENVAEFLKSEQERFPDEDFSYIKKLTKNDK